MINQENQENQEDQEHQEDREGQTPDIAEIRQYNISAISRATGLSRNHVSCIMAGKMEPRISTAWKIAHFLGVSLEELMRYTSNKAAMRQAKSAHEFTSEYGNCTKCGISQREAVGTATVPAHTICNPTTVIKE